MTEDAAAVAAHRQKVTHSYWVSYPAHPARAGDPHYVDFEAYRKATHATAQCAIGEHRGDFSECSPGKPLELHHAHIAVCLRTGADRACPVQDYPRVTDPAPVRVW